MIDIRYYRVISGGGGGEGSELQISGGWGRKGVNLIIMFPERLAIDTGHQASVLQQFLICRGE